MLRHPRDPVSCVERLACLLAYVLTTMTLNAIFYGNSSLVTAAAQPHVGAALTGARRAPTSRSPS